MKPLHLSTSVVPLAALLTTTAQLTPPSAIFKHLAPVHTCRSSRSVAYHDSMAASNTAIGITILLHLAPCLCLLWILGVELLLSAVQRQLQLSTTICNTFCTLLSSAVQLQLLLSTTICNTFCTLLLSTEQLQLQLSTTICNTFCTLLSSAVQLQLLLSTTICNTLHPFVISSTASAATVNHHMQHLAPFCYQQYSFSCHCRPPYATPYCTLPVLLPAQPSASAAQPQLSLLSAFKFIHIVTLHPPPLYLPFLPQH